MYQQFQPIGGVRASASPTTSLSPRRSEPSALVAERVTAYSPRSPGVRPVMMPEAASSVILAGSPSAPKVIGRLPVQGMR